MLRTSLRVGMFSLLLFALASAQEINNNTAWEMVNKALVDHLLGLDKTLLARYSIQLPSADLYAIWNDPDEGQWSLLEIADAVGDWSPTWVPNTANRFSDAYADFVSNIQIPTRPNVDESARKRKEKEWGDAATKAKAANTYWENEWGKVVDDLRKHPNKPKKTRQTWWRENASPHVDPLNDARDKAFADYFNLLDPAAITTAKQIARWKSYTPIPVKTPKIGAEDHFEDRYPYFASNKVLEKLVADGEAQYQAKKMISWEFKTGSSYRHDERESWSVNASYGGFLRVGGGANGSRHTLDTSQSGVKLQYGFYKLAIVPITPGEWYVGTLVSKFKDGPFKPDSTVSAKTLWGPTGSLRLRAAAVVVAYKPQISAYLSKTDYHLLQEAYQAGGSVSIGPFSFGGSHTRSLEHETHNEAEGKFSVESVSPNPQIVAILFEKLNSH